LFFHADRCPACVRAEKNFLASGIPEDLNLIKVDYDDNPELREQYGILSQTSYVYVKPDGSLISSWVGSMSIGDILENIEKSK
jgi:thioredoxin 1